jgi:hypothetical protein
MLINRKIKWLRPKHTTLLIVDSTGSFFSEIITIPLTRLLNTSDYVYFNFSMFIRLLCGRLSITHIKNRYKEYLILSHNPSYTISFSDFDACSITVFNSNKFKAGVVQIGLRGSLAIQLGKRSSFNCYYCFGENVKKFFIENKSKINEYKVIGSVKNNHYWHVLRPSSKLLPDKIYDYCLIASYRESDDKSSAEYINFVHMIKFLIRLATDNENIKASVIIHFHKVTVKNTVELLTLYDKLNKLDILTSKGTYDSYFNLEKSRFLLSSGSSLGCEAFSQGKRILFYNFTTDKDFDFPSMGGEVNELVDKVLIKTESYSALCNKISSIKKIPEKEWMDIINNVARKEIYFNEKSNPNSVLIDDIHDAL